MKTIIVASIAGMFAVGGCVPLGSNNRRIPDGVYQAKSERVEVRRDRMGFFIQPVSGKFSGRKYVESFGHPYSLRGDGSIVLSGSSNSSVYVFELIEYKWKWTGKSIKRSDGLEFVRGDGS